MRALWTYETVGRLNEALLRRLLEAKDYRIRAAAVRSVTRHRSELRDGLALLRARIGDDHARVRVEAVRALAVEKSPEAMSWALAALDKGTDDVLSYELALNARETASRWIPELNAGRFLGQPSDRWITLLIAVDTPAAVQPLQKILAMEKEMKPDEEEKVLAFIGRHGQPADLNWLIAQSKEASTTPKVRARILSSLLEAFRLRQVRPEGDLLPSVNEWLDSKDDAIRQEGIQLVGLWRLESLRGRLADIIRSDRDAKQREMAIESLRQLGGEESLALLIDFFKSGIDSSVRQARWRPLSESTRK